MYNQLRNQPRTLYEFRITEENYDYLYRLARQRDISIPRLLNELIARCRGASTGVTCASSTVGEKVGQYARTRCSDDAGYASAGRASSSEA